MLDELKKHELPLNLQFFAGEDPEDDVDPGVDPDGNNSTDGDPEGDNGKKQKKDEKVFTQEELEAIVKKRLARAKKDAEEAVEEAKKLAKMNAEQKREYELEKLRRENEELKAAKNRYELGKEASKMLAESGITATEDILDFVVQKDAEKTSEAVKAFADLVDRISDEKMKEKLRGTPPKRGTTQDGFKNPFSQEHWNLTEQGRLLREDPELYKRLKAQAGQ